MKTLLAILSVVACTANAELYLYNSRLGQQAPELPYYVRAIDVATTNHGWSLPVIPVQLYPASCDEQTLAWVPWADRERLPEAIAQTKLASERERMEREWPLLTEHPATSEVPDSGMTYRLDDGTNKTFWVARQGDLIATQISAHDGDGNEITATRDLRTGAERIIRLRDLSDSVADRSVIVQLRRDARTVRTNMTANIKAMQTTASLTNGFTARENRQLVNDLRRELIDAQQEVKELARIVGQLMKESD